MEQAVEKGKTAVSTAVKGLVNAAKGNAHVLVIVGVFLLLVLMVMSGFSSCGILFSGGTQVSGQTIYSAEDRDIWGAEQDYKKLEKELDKKIKRTPTDHPGYNEYQYHLDPIEHDPWQLTSFLTTLYDDYTRSEVQGKLKETLKGSDTEAIKNATEELTKAFYAVSEKLYQQQAPQGDAAAQQPGGDTGAQGGQYYDADYKVVDDDDQNK